MFDIFGLEAKKKHPRNITLWDRVIPTFLLKPSDLLGTTKKLGKCEFKPDRCARNQRLVLEVFLASGFCGGV